MISKYSWWKINEKYNDTTFRIFIIADEKLINEKNYHTTLKAGLSEENFGLCFALEHNVSKAKQSLKTGFSWDTFAFRFRCLSQLTFIKKLKFVTFEVWELIESKRSPNFF